MAQLTPIRGPQEDFVPNLRRSNPWDWIVNAGKVVGAAAILVGAAATVNSWVAQRASAGIVAVVEPKLEALKAGQLISDQQRGRHDTEVDAKLGDLAKSNRDINAKLAALQRQLAKRQKSGGGAVGTAETP